MVLEGATKVVSHIVSKAPESAGRLAGHTEKVSKQAVEGAGRTIGKVKEGFKKGLEASRNSPHETKKLVDDLATRVTQPVETPVGAAQGSPEQSAAESTTETATQKPQERVKDRLQKNLSEAQEKAKIKVDDDERFKGEGVVRDESGYPTDPALRQEYFNARQEANKNTLREALVTTASQEYEEDNPPPNEKKDPVGFAKWLEERQEFIDTSVNQQDKAKVALDQMKKGQEDPTTKDAEPGESAEASMFNAIKLSLKLDAAAGEERKAVEQQIQEIHDANPNIKPRFKARISIARVLIMGALSAGTVMLVGAKDVARDAVAK